MCCKLSRSPMPPLWMCYRFWRYRHEPKIVGLVPPAGVFPIDASVIRYEFVVHKDRAR
jgi:hypothetical protein